MSLKRVLLAGVGALALSSCATQNQPVGDEGRAVSGIAPAGADQVLAIDTDGLTFAASPGTDGRFTLAIDSTRPVSLFVVGADVRVLKMAASAGAPRAQTVLPNWTGEVSTAQLSTCDCDEDGADDEDAASSEDNPLEQIDSDDDGESNFDDGDDDGDGSDDDGDDDADGSGELDSDEDLDTDDDGSPDRCDHDDDGDGTRDEDDTDHEEGDHDGDGVRDDRDHDDDNDGDHDDEDDDDDGDGVRDDDDGDHHDGDGDGRDGPDGDGPDGGEGEGEGENL